MRREAAPRALLAPGLPIVRWSCQPVDGVGGPWSALDHQHKGFGCHAGVRFQHSKPVTTCLRPSAAPAAKYPLYRGIDLRFEPIRTVWRTGLMTPTELSPSPNRSRCWRRHPVAWSKSAYALKLVPARRSTTVRQASYSQWRLIPSSAHPALGTAVAPARTS
jgi:hypothetical protein